MEKASFEEVRKHLTEKFLREAATAETDEELGSAFLDLILQSERMRHGVKVSGPQQAQVDRRTLERLHSQTELGPEYAFAESVFKRMAKDPASAMRYFFESKAQLRAVQTERAKKNRTRSYDSITKLINDIVDLKPGISTHEVRRELATIVGIMITDDEIRNKQDENTMKVSNLASRVSDARLRAKKQSAEPG
jgi:hypothetical protein